MDKVHGSVFSAVKLDLRGSVMGFAVEIEVKMPGEKPSPRQAQRIRFLKKMGVITGCCESVEEAVSIVREGLDRRRGRAITQEEIKQWAKD